MARKKKDLENDAADWLPENTSPSGATSRDEPQNTVTLIQDPFGIQTPAIAEQQDSLEELDLDTDLELQDDPETVEYDLSSLARAMREESDRMEKELEATVEAAQTELEAESSELLARQIAEDEALQRAENANASEDESEGLGVDANLLDLAEMQSCIETLLFMSDKPLSAEKLQDLLGPEVPLTRFEEAITGLQERYSAMHHGFELAHVAGGFQFRTKPGRAALARKLARVQTQRLSSGAMETLAIIAYKQPALKDDVDSIRGVDSSHFIRTLIDRKLITITGRSDLPGRPMVYSTTPEFLELFGLGALEDMPSLAEIEQMVPATDAGKDSEDPRVREMRRLVGEMKSSSQSILDYDPREDDALLKDIRERVNQIPTSTPYLDEQKALEKAEKEASLAALQAGASAPEAPLDGAQLQLEPAPVAAEVARKAVSTAPAEERISAD